MLYVYNILAERRPGAPTLYADNIRSVERKKAPAPVFTEAGAFCTCGVR